MNTKENWHGTTIVLIRKGKETIVAGDGQVSLGQTVIKEAPRKFASYLQVGSTSYVALPGQLPTLLPY